MSVDFNEQISVESSEQIAGNSIEIIRVEIGGAKVRPLPLPSLLLERRMPAFRISILISWFESLVSNSKSMQRPSTARQQNVLNASGGFTRCRLCRRPR